MKIKIKRIDPSLPLPQYHTPGAVAFDFYSRIDATIEPHGFAMLPTNFIIETPKGYMLMIAARSSSAKKKGLTMRNGVAIIDQDYCGPEDEIFILVQNLTDDIKQIEKGERIAQGMFVRIDQFAWEEVEEMTAATSRGGFGTTG